MKEDEIFLQIDLALSDRSYRFTSCLAYHIAANVGASTDGS
jgi:hypothetical protein